MTFSIQVNPSHRVFELQGKESILRAGMREGFNFAHHCMNGSCGQCVAQLVSGEVEQIRHHDFVLSEEQKQQGAFLTCCHRAKTDITIEIHELHDVNEIPVQNISVKVAKLELLQDSVMQLHLRTPRSKVLEFFAGQRVQLCLPQGECVDLGISSCPCDGMNLRFHLRLDDQQFTKEVFKQLKKGSKLDIKGPHGEFVLNESSKRPLIFMAWETGFSQVQSIIDHVISLDEDRQMTLYWFSRIKGGHYLSNYCRSWRDTLDHFQYESVDLQPIGHDTLETVLKRWVSEKTDFVDSDVYAIMPEVELTYVQQFLVENGLPETQWKGEVWER